MFACLEEDPGRPRFRLVHRRFWRLTLLPAYTKLMRLNVAQTARETGDDYEMTPKTSQKVSCPSRHLSTRSIRHLGKHQVLIPVFNGRGMMQMQLSNHLHDHFLLFERLLSLLCRTQTNRRASAST